jgi:cell shape-determining protein MreC
MTQHAKHEHDLRQLRRKIQVLEKENERLVELLNSQAI